MNRFFLLFTSDLFLSIKNANNKFLGDEFRFIQFQLRKSQRQKRHLDPFRKKGCLDPGASQGFPLC